MAQITASLVKQLRDKTGAGMMNCKKALIETDGDMENAIDWLRKKGLSAAAKKSGRTAAEGLVSVATRGNVGVLVELNAETDFVARNETFQRFVRSLAELALDCDGTVQGLKAMEFPGSGHNVEEHLTHMIATIGENMILRRVARIEVEEGIVGSYMHARLDQDVGKIGVIVGLKSGGDADKLAGLGKHLAMHVAASRPESVTIDQLDQVHIARERDILAEQARASGKPEAIVEKIVDGRLRKYYEEVVLLEQIYVIDQDNKVAKAVEDAARDCGAPVEIVAFERFTLGEGVEKEESDFASEVAAQLAS
ncbi:MAG: translation elongation factor Ts [Pseudomonadota bacterium]|nr:translation elongation factor Ts [Pseudomonadota bacterium]